MIWLGADCDGVAATYKNSTNLGICNVKRESSASIEAFVATAM